MTGSPAAPRTDEEVRLYFEMVERAKAAQSKGNGPDDGLALDQDGGQDETETLPLSQSDCSRWVGKEPPELPFTVAGLAPKGMTTLLIADGGAGKSMLMQIALTCCPSGLPFLGMATLAGNTAGLFAEDGEAVLHVRQCRINDALDVDMEDLSGRSFLKSYQGENAVLWNRDGPTTFFDEL